MRAGSILGEEADREPLGPAADRPGVVESGGGRRAAWQNEGLQRRQVRVEGVDLPLEAFDLDGQDAQGLWRAVLSRRRGEIGAEVEKVVLNASEDRIERLVAGRFQTSEANDGVEFVDIAIGRNARLALLTVSPLASRVVPELPVRV